VRQPVDLQAFGLTFDVVKVQDNQVSLATVDTRLLCEVTPDPLLECTAPLANVRHVARDIGLPIAGVVLATVFRDTHLAATMPLSHGLVPEPELVNAFGLSTPRAGLHERPAPSVRY
jgi:hypothetical protein